MARACDIKGSAVVWRCADEGHAEGHVYAAVKIKGLDWDQRLIVVHA